MSVVGIDVGNDTSCVALARKGGIDVLLNKESVRETPAVVNFGEKMRFLGVDGAAKQGLQPANTINQLKRLLGKKFKDPKVQADIAKLPFKVSEAPNGGCQITCMYQNESVDFTPEQLMAMVMVDLKKIAERETGHPPVDCVLSVPVYYTEAQRYAMLNAASIAGLNCLRLMNETTATALAYGIFKTDLPETDPVHVAFVDVGHSSTQVSIVALKKHGLQVLCHVWDSDLGGRNLDELLFDHFAAEFKQTAKIDIPSNKKASFKLRTAVGKLKKILSANPEAPLNIECIMDDKDVRGMITRDTFEELMSHLSDRFKLVLEQSLVQSGLSADALSAVEVVGSSTRVPALVRLIESVYGKAPSRTMNAKECVCRGAALQCAMLSPTFKVREYEVIDSVPFKVDFRWEKDGKPAGQTLFERNSPFPAAKVITFLRAEPFTITAVNGDTGELLSTYQIGPFTVPPGQETAKLKVKISMNLHGIVTVETVQSVVEEEATEANGDTGAAPMDTDSKDAAPKAEAAATEPKKKRVIKTDVPFTASAASGYSQKDIDLFFEKEGQMQAMDRLMEETAFQKNAVEAYLYKLRNGLYGPLEKYASAQEKEKILAKLQETEDWLYDEGEDCTKSVYTAKLEELKQLGGPVETRAEEAETRPAAIAQLRSVAQSYVHWAQSSEARYAHITVEERAPIANEAQAALTWLADKEALQSKLGPTDTPVLLSSDCHKKVDTLERLAKPIVNKPAPKPAAPKPATPSPEPPTETGEEGPAPMDSEEPGASPAPMDS